jgi:hypothetical protein
MAKYMHSNELLLKASAFPSKTVDPTIEETFVVEKCAQKAETAEPGTELTPAKADAARTVPAVECCCAWEVAGSKARDAAQPLAASSAPTSRRAQALDRRRLAASVWGGLAR